MPYSGTCLECGKAFHGKRQPAKFCSHACRVAFTNRRRDRGAELYDIVMSLDQETRTHAIPRNAYEFGLRDLVEAWHKEDRRDRKGRQSWINR